MAPRQLNSVRVPHYGQESSGTASRLTTANAIGNIRKQRPALHWTNLRGQGHHPLRALSPTVAPPPLIASDHRAPQGLVKLMTFEKLSWIDSWGGVLA